MNHSKSYNLSEYPTGELIHLGRLLSAQITNTKHELEAVEEILRSRALAMPHEPLANGSREGRRATLRDENAQITVLFESDILKASFASDSPLAKSVLPLLDTDQTASIFKVKTTYERRISDGHKFRILCADSLPQELAGRVIDLLKDRDRNGIVKSKSVIEWTA